MWGSGGNGADLSVVLHEKGGYADLRIGASGALGADSYCNHGGTYAGTPGQICGNAEYKFGAWGETNMEVWFLATQK
jgi:hypothetical protein